MKILQVIPYFTPKKGGDVNVCCNLSKKLVGHGHNVTIITSNSEFDESYAKDVMEFGVKILKFRCVFSMKNFFVSPGMITWLKNNISNFDIVHVHDFRTYQNVLVFRYSKKFSIPYLVHAHGDIPILIEKQYLKKLYDFFWGNNILKNASRFIAISEEEAEDYKKRGEDVKKISVIYNGLDFKSFSSLPKNGQFKKKYGINGKMILYLGRIHKTKGIDLVIKSFSKLKREINNVNLVIVGSDNGYKRELERLTSSLKIADKVRFIGYVDEKDKLSAFTDADLFVHPVLYMGGVGIAPLEAILCNTPVIVTEECGEIIKQANCGYFVKYGDVNGLKERIEHVFDYPDDASQLIENGKNYFYKNLAWDDVVRKFEKVYSEIIREN